MSKQRLVDAEQNSAFGTTNGDAKPKSKRGLDKEIQAMARVDRLLAELEPATVHRILIWLRSRYEDRYVGPQDLLAEEVTP